MIKGDRIKLTKEMGAFTNVGEVCEVIDVSEGGVISFRFGPGGCHLGCMSYDEYQKYFEPVVEEKEHRVWTQWKTMWVYYHNFDGKIICHEALYRHNGKKVQVKSAVCGLRAEASCCHKDEFDCDKGKDLAEKRLIVKLLEQKVKEIAKEM